MTVDILKEKGLPVPQQGFKDSLSLKLNDIEVYCYYLGAGHSTDNIVAWIPSEQILFGGCMVKDLNSKELGNLSDAKTEEWPETIQKVIAKFPDVKTIIPGHGRIGGVELLNHTKELLIKKGERNCMKTAIIYTSKHGTTAKVAQMIAERLTGNQVSIIDLKKDKRPDINSFDGIILGTPIYAGTPSKAMQRFCKENFETLKQKRLALFVCGMEPDSVKQQQELANAYPQELYGYAVSTCFAGGEFQFEKMNFFERAIIKRIAKTDKSVSQIGEKDIEKFVAEY
jgi:menaquinone-dependent protoporphyrinogen IX oxidase